MKNRLIPIKFDRMGIYSNPYWLYQCSCGNTKVICKWSVDSGKTKSCGCIRNEKSTIRNRTDIEF